MRGSRSLLFTPANDPKKICKGLQSEAHVLILDLEDAVAVSQKEEARRTLMQTLKETTADKSVCVRINGLRTPYWMDDVRCLRQLGIAAVMLPKAESKEEILRLAEAWETAEARGPKTGSSLEIVPLIESARGVEHAYEIAAAHPAVARLAFGAVDLSLELGIDPDEAQTEFLYTRSRLVMVSAAAGLPGPIDSVQPNLNEQTRLRCEAERSRRLGFTGKMAVHPKQLPAIHEVWGYNDASRERDLEIVKVFEAAEKDGKAAVAVDGQMVDYPVYKQALQRLRSGNQKVE